MQKLSKWILKITGWKAFVTVGEPEKSIICVAPHTSNWDFPIGKLSYLAMGRKASFLIKKSWFVFPLNFFFSALGGVPVDRSKRTSVTQQMVDEFNNRKHFHLAITPEGTRSLVDKWKMGFYHIANQANVPIQLAYIDYEKKELAIKEIFYPTGDEEADLAKIQDYYKDIHAKFPGKFNLSR
ncbi:MAG TPA: lysophospholipid acyltransferase family protein [Paludibacter sp.]|nr:lysophospholipid acyltransferase family protein [Paludibacter sp.]